MKSQTDPKDAWRNALNYLLKYERHDSYRAQRVGRARDFIQELISKGAIGELTDQRFEEIKDALDFQEHRIARDAFITNIHSTVLTANWFDRLACRLVGKTVLELGAYRGCMIQPMNKRGVKWIGVQTDPDPDCFMRPIPVQDYVAAVKGYRKKIDYIFMSWPALCMDEETQLRILDAARHFDIPILMVGERRMNTSACNAFWDQQWSNGYRVVSFGLEPSQWRGLRDVLWLVVDEKHLQDRSETSGGNFGTG